MDINNQIKLMSYDRLIDELHALHDMYFDFANSTDNIMAGSSFHIAAKDLETLLSKYGDNKKSPATMQD